MTTLQKITNVRLPFDMRDPDPSKNYGIHGLDIWFILKGPKGAVQYAVTFPVYLPHIDKSDWKYDWNQIRGFDVGYHSLTPMFDGQQKMRCQHLEGGQCYYDGSVLQADDWTKIIFAARGVQPEKVIWEMLEDEYRDRFGPC